MKTESRAFWTCTILFLLASIVPYHLLQFLMEKFPRDSSSSITMVVILILSYIMLIVAWISDFLTEFIAGSAFDGFYMLHIRRVVPISLLITCILAIFPLYWISGVMFVELTGELIIRLDTVATLADIVLWITAISFVVVCVSKFFQSKKFGIPFRLGRPGVHDAISIWIEFFGLTGLGIGLPFAILSWSFLIFFDAQSTPDFMHLIQIATSIIVIFIVFFGINFCSLLTARIPKHLLLIKRLSNYGWIEPVKKRIRKFTNDGRSRINVFFWLSIILSVSLTCFYLAIHTSIFHQVYAANIILNVAMTIVAIYFVFILIMLTANIIAGLVCEYDESATVEIDGKLYLFAMKYDEQNRILTPCWIVKDYVAATVLAKLLLPEAILFDKGRFIIKGVAELNGLEVKVYEAMNFPASSKDKIRRFGC